VRYLESAIATADDALVRYRTVRSLFGEVFLTCIRPDVLEMGRRRDAEATLRQAVRLARDSTGPNTEAEAVAPQCSVWWCTKAVS